MKRTKLITSLCTLILTIACLTFGVYSAVNTTFTATGTLIFNAYGLDVDVDCTITGAKAGVTDNVLTYKGTSTKTDATKDSTRQPYNGKDITKASDAWVFSTAANPLQFDELGIDENGDETENKIIFTIRIYNYSKYPIQTKTTVTKPDNLIATAPTDVTYLNEFDTSAAVGTIVIELTPNGQKFDPAALSFQIELLPAERLIEAAPSQIEYVPVEYIESNGTQYIDTGLTTSYNNKALVGIQITEKLDSDTFHQIFGNYKAGTGGQGDFGVYISKNDKCWWYSLNAGQKQSNNKVYAQLNKMYNIEFSKDAFILNGSVLSDNIVKNEYSSSVLSFYLFWAGNVTTTGEVDRAMHGRMYYAKIYDGDELVRDYIPCYKKGESSTVGMFDKVTNKFYGNSGSGNFALPKDWCFEKNNKCIIFR